MPPPHLRCLSKARAEGLGGGGRGDRAQTKEGNSKCVLPFERKEYLLCLPLQEPFNQLSREQLLARSDGAMLLRYSLVHSFIF